MSQNKFRITLRSTHSTRFQSKMSLTIMNLLCITWAPASSTLRVGPLSTPKFPISPISSASARISGPDLNLNLSGLQLGQENLPGRVLSDWKGCFNPGLKLWRDCHNKLFCTSYCQSLTFLRIIFKMLFIQIFYRLFCLCEFCHDFICIK